MLPQSLQKIIDGKWPIESFPPIYLCHVIKMKDPINYDIHFLVKDPMESRKDMLISTVYSYNVIDSATFEKSPVIHGRCYRARLAGIISIDSPTILFPTFKHITGDHLKKKRTFRERWRFNEANFQMVRWCYITGNIFGCIIRGIDIHRRLIVDLIDVVTGINVREYLLDMFSDVYKTYSRPNENEETDDISIDSSKARDSSVSTILVSNK